MGERKQLRECVKVDNLFSPTAAPYLLMDDGKYCGPCISLLLWSGKKHPSRREKGLIERGRLQFQRTHRRQHQPRCAGRDGQQPTPECPPSDARHYQSTVFHLPSSFVHDYNLLDVCALSEQIERSSAGCDGLLSNQSFFGVS